MWIAIRQFDGALVAGQRRRYLPGDAVPEASKWRDLKMWKRWVLDVPDDEVVDGRWAGFEQYASRGRAQAPKKPHRASVPADAAQPVHPVVVTQFVQPPAMDASPDAAPSAEASGETQPEGDRPKRRRRSTLVGQ